MKEAGFPQWSGLAQSCPGHLSQTHKRIPELINAFVPGPSGVVSPSAQITLKSLRSWSSADNSVPLQHGQHGQQSEYLDVLFVVVDLERSVDSGAKCLQDFWGIFGDNFYDRTGSISLCPWKGNGNGFAISGILQASRMMIGTRSFRATCRSGGPHVQRIRWCL